jgi:hypothetical protein
MMSLGVPASSRQCDYYEGIDLQSITAQDSPVFSAVDDTTLIVHSYSDGEDVERETDPETLLQFIERERERVIQNLSSDHDFSYDIDDAERTHYYYSDAE